jgi:hypothetical protein
VAAGLDASGNFTAETIRSLQDALQSSAQTEFGVGANTSSDGVIGRLIDMLAAPLGEAWELLQALNDAFDPAAAPDRLLFMLGRIRGLERDPATRTQVTLRLYNSTSTAATVPLGSLASKGEGGPQFESLAAATIPAGSNVDVLFEAVDTGVIETPINSVQTIVTAIAGWTSVTNLSIESYLGTDAESPEAFRLRLLVPQADGSRTLGSILAGVLDRDDIDQAIVLENVTETDDTSITPTLTAHSIMVVYYPAITDYDGVAQVILDRKAEGVRTVGSESGTALDAQGDEVTVYMHEADPFYVEAEFTATVNSSAPADWQAQIRAAAVAYIQDNILGGRKVYIHKMLCAADGIEGIETISVTMREKGVGSLAASNLTVAATEVARVQDASTDITFA